MAACTPTTQSSVVPGDTINLKGPDVSADQKALNITWSYQWTVRSGSATGTIVNQSTGQNFAFTVPATGYASNYYVDLMVTAVQATLCINEACMLFPVAAIAGCSITGTSTVCVSDTTGYTYSTAATPTGVNQRWWIFPLASFPSDPSTIGYTGQTSYKKGDGNQITGIKWNGYTSGTYVVFSGYYGKTSPYTYQGSCQTKVVVVGVPNSTISVL